MNAVVVYYTPTPIQESGKDVVDYRVGRMFPSSGVVSITAPWFANIPLEQVRARVSRGLDSVIKEGSDTLAPQPRSVKSLTFDQSLEKEFYDLLKKWNEETFALSSLTKIYAHPAYQRIIGMGTRGLGFVLKELQKGEGHWLYALKYMAGENVSAGMKSFEDAKSAWLEWGYKNNYI